jgi:hypothetical protein
MPFNNILFKESMKYGLYYAIISIAISLIAWGAKAQETLSITGNFIFGITSAVIYVLILIYFTKKFRDKELEGSIDFRQAFQIGLFTVIFSSIILALYNFIFNAWIDPGYQQRILDSLPEKTYNMLSHAPGITEEMIDESLKTFEKIKAPTPIETMFSSLESGFLGGLFFALISALIVKKNKAKNGFDQAMSKITDEE